MGENKITETEVFDMLIDGTIPDLDGEEEVAAKQDENTDKQEVTTQDTDVSEQSGEEKSTDEKQEEENPAPILSKSGTYTIPYEKLETARNRVKQLEAEINELRSSMTKTEAKEVAKEVEQAKAEDAKSGDTSATDDLFKRLADEWGDDFANGLRQASAMAVAPVLEENKALKERLARMESEFVPIKNRMVKSDIDAHFDKIASKYADFEETLESEQFNEWKKSKPSFVQASIDAVIERGTAEQGIEVLKSFHDETDKKGLSPDEVKAKAEAAAKAAKEKGLVPRSLSDFPGQAGPTDEIAALKGMSSMQILDSKLIGKTPEETWEYLDRIL